MTTIIVEGYNGVPVGMEYLTLKIEMSNYAHRDGEYESAMDLKNRIVKLMEDSFTIIKSNVISDTSINN